MHITTALTCATLGGGAITGIGSLPHADPAAAVQLVAEFCPEIPFWPQLPQRAPGELMVAQALVPVADLLRTREGRYGYQLEARNRATLLNRLADARGELTPAVAAGFFALEAALAANAFPRAVALKGQIIGPLTLAAQIFVDEQPLLYDPEGLAVVSAYVESLARWQITRLARWRTPVLLMLDEPCLAFLPEPGDGQMLAIVQGLSRALRAAGALVGVHCCATLPDRTPPLALLCATGADVVSFDAYQRSEAFCTEPAVRSFLASGGVLAFGIVPTFSDLTSVSLADLLVRWIVASRSGPPGIALKEHTIITATCGLGLLTESVARRSFELARELASAVAGATL
ncbi:MAG: hypothetical protein RMK84_06150 [Oscillochloridaceae bacterium]|nr:hypothetical protein [Chloroflexaceae bacterium]MDW8389688.1 hypothetical protein [Oscillochloridaceae bacterium]